MYKPKSINSTQIAKLAGVSRSTVSKVINNYPDIPEETKKKVRSVIEKHRYVPNASAQVLKGKPQSVIALYVYASEVDVEADSLCSLNSPYVMSVISNFIMTANQHDHRLMIELLRHGQDEQDIIRGIEDLFESKSIAAAAFLGLTDSVKFIDKLIAHNYPLAVIDREINDHYQAVNIFTDDFCGSYEATSHLIEEGFRRIAFVKGDSNKHSARSREMGFLKAMNQHGLKPVLIDATFNQQGGMKAADSLLNMESRPEAVVCASDGTAYGLIQRLHESDEQYVNQLGIIGFDNTFFNDFQRPPLSSVKVDFAAMAQQTVTALLQPEHYQPTPIPVEVVVRASSQFKSQS